MYFNGSVAFCFTAVENLQTNSFGFSKKYGKNKKFKTIKNNTWFYKKDVLLYYGGQKTAFALIAQLDRASGYGPEGREFESCHVHYKSTCITQVLFCALQWAMHIQIKTGRVELARKRPGFDLDVYGECRDSEQKGKQKRFVR